MAIGGSKASLIKDDPFLVQLLCDLYTAPCDTKGYYKPADIAARYEREKGLANVIQHIEVFADDYGLLEWGGETDPDKRQFFRNTEAMESTLDDLRRHFGDRFRDPRDDSSRNADNTLKPAIVTDAERLASKSNPAPAKPAARPKHVSTTAPHRPETGLVNASESTISPVDPPLSGDEESSDPASNAQNDAQDDGSGIMQGEPGDENPSNTSKGAGSVAKKKKPVRTFGK